MKQVSDKTRARNLEYARRRRLYLLTHPNCEIIFDNGCGLQAFQTHHVIPRAHLTDEQMLVEANWLATCHYCHEKVHWYPGLSYERGHLRKSWEWGWWESVAAEEGVNQGE